MNRVRMGIALVVAMCSLGLGIGRAAPCASPPQPTPECCKSPGCHHCVAKVEPEPIKKVVYDVKCVPVCEHQPGKFLSCDCCPVCKLAYKRVLIKREIVVGQACKVKCEPVKGAACRSCQ